jgi:hypothetical protein
MGKHRSPYNYAQKLIYDGTVVSFMDDSSEESSW